ncbi:hypothetical protein CEXT_310901 [Caerostris extrusa]|uniref:Uncharacterized protein n=1 Tax=Caerostris extrusa TaxID=172846 RepID=A0AAV4WZD3_CAEEX|nr:hypothetical protein CEXT_310901 [Caerostris extrusa]
MDIKDIPTFPYKSSRIFEEKKKHSYDKVYSFTHYANKVNYTNCKNLHPSNALSYETLQRSVEDESTPISMGGICDRLPTPLNVTFCNNPILPEAQSP